MTPVVLPLSEDFLYWDPEEICRYPQPAGLEDAWFAECDSDSGSGAVPERER